MQNMHSFSNKVEELLANVNHNYIYRHCSMAWFTEIWLTMTTPSSYVRMDGWTLHKYDRDAAKMGWKSGGGVCLYLNNLWCHPSHTTEKNNTLYSRHWIAWWWVVNHIIFPIHLIVLVMYIPILVCTKVATHVNTTIMKTSSQWCTVEGAS